jgi:phage terminase large subunit GpA-like protein
LVLPSDVSALPGRVVLAPYMREIASALSDPTIERVTLVKSVRVGYTTLLTAMIGATISNDPGPILALLPTESDARDYAVSDLEPIFNATPTLHGVLSADTGEENRNTLLSRRFPGGSLRIVAARAPRNLRRMNVKTLLIDEADAMEAGAEGSPIALAEKRTLSFPNRKIILGSTPIFEEGNILRSYRESDQRIFEVPCPECGSFHEIIWSDIHWSEGSGGADAHYVCPECGSIIEETRKAAMVAAGRWRATVDVRGHAGFRLNALVSVLANASWDKLAAEFIAAKDHPDQLQSFVNTTLAQGWKEAAEELDEGELASRAEPFGLDAIPADVLLITVGIDVQRDRLHALFLGHGRTDLYVLGESVIWGEPGSDDTWQECADLLRTSWPHPLGKDSVLRIEACAIDSGDGVTTDAVLGFTKTRFAQRVVAIKGVSGQRPIISASKTKGSKLFIVGVDSLKGQITNRIARGRSVHFSKNLESRFFEELASERLILSYSRGQPSRLWTRKVGMRAEALDAFCYALAVRGIVSLDLDRREGELTSGRPAAPSPRVIKSAWLNR